MSDDTIKVEVKINCKCGESFYIPKLNEAVVCNTCYRVYSVAIDTLESDLKKFMKISFPLTCSCLSCNMKLSERHAKGVETIWEGRLNGYCFRCAEMRCDSIPGQEHSAYL